MQTGDIRLIKNINVRLVLNLIRQYGEISGARLAQITGMRPSTISNILKELDKKNLIINKGKGESTNKGGKRPFLWTLNENSNYIIGLDIEIGEITTLVLNLNGDIIFNKITKTEVFKNLDQFSACIREIVDASLKELSFDCEDILGMGIAVAGIVNQKDGVIKVTDILPDRDIPLLEALEEHFQFPLVIENNANAAALGTKWVGNGKECLNFITVLMEIHKRVGGLGLGLVINRNLYHGSSFCAGELNIKLPTLDEKVLEFKDQFFEGKVLKNYIHNIDDVDIDVIINATAAGDKVAVRLIEDFGHILGDKLKRVVLAFNPEKVILTGQIARTGELLAASVYDELKHELEQIHTEELIVESDGNGRYIVSIGAAALILDEFFKVPLVNIKTKVSL
ncbi:MAG: ROK family transcriptional regulator [Candidatus Marinimicrobia bacterium]|nr:ROK family transcriptional regulator [Candidatus Neomarinimicrobiota bacterium]